MKPTLRTRLPQRLLLHRQLILLILRLVTDGTDAQQPRADELEVRDDVFHDGSRVRSPRLAVLVVGVLVPVVEGASAGPEAALVVPGAIVGVLPPGQVEEAGEGHEVAAGVGEEELELGIGVGTGEADSLHAEIDGHRGSWPCLWLGKLKTLS